MTPPFILAADGWHELTKRRYLGRIAAQVVAETELGDRYRRYFLGNRPPCQLRGRLLDQTTCGCPVYQCKIYGTCSTNRRAGLRLCQECNDYKQPEGNHDSESTAAR